MSVLEPFPLPRNLLAGAGSGKRQEWTASLPERVRALQKRWALDLAAPFQPGGQTAWVAPAHSVTFGDVVLKVAWRHWEAADEADGLREWNGNGTVRVHETVEFDDTIALLVERCVPGTPLATLDQTEQDRTIAGLLRRLWRAPSPGHRFRPLQLMCDAWADQFEHKTAAGRGTVDSDLASEGVALFRSLPATAERSVLLCTDLHAENVLGAEREPWLVIDPKPFVGDPTYDVLQHMLNCRERLEADPRDLTRRMADLLSLDSDRLALWLFARCVIESVDRPDLGRVARRIAPASGPGSQREDP
jgi:streptomycin 6-kinase